MRKLFLFFVLFLSASALDAATGWYSDYVLINPNNSGSVYYWIGSNPGFGTQLGGNNFGNVSSLVITSCDMKYWSDNQDRTGGSFFYKIMSSDGITQIIAPVETIWDQAYLGGNDYQGTKTLSLNMLNGLTLNTTYQLHVWAKNWGTSQGDQYLSNLGANYVATFTYTATTFSGTGDWTDPARWNTGLPANTSSAIISGTATISTAVTINGLEISNGYSLTINAGKSLTVTGTTTTNGGLVLKSPSSLGASGSFLPTGAVTGDVTVERFIPAYTSNADGWYFLSSPVSTQAISPNFAPGSTDAFYRWSESVTDNPWINYKGSSFSNFTPGEGYLVSYQTASSPKTFTGALNQSNITLTDQLYTTASTWHGWHLLGNPYSCALIWNDGNWSMSNVEAIAQIMNSGGTYTARSANDPIPAMNGFMVHVTSGTNSMTIPLAARAHNAAEWLKNAAETGEKLMLTAASSDNTTYVETIVQFNTGATSAFDMAFDGHFISGIEVAPQLYSRVGDEHLCVNTLPQNAASGTVPLGFVKGSSVNYTMNCTGLASFNPGVSVILEDLREARTQDLRQSPVYSFSAADGDDTDRFLLHFGGSYAVNDPANSNAIRIYSANDALYVADNTGKAVKGDVYVYSMIGQLMMQQELSGSNLTKISLNGNTGYYLVKVVTGEMVYSGKVFMK